jgi:hypothetical protein
VFREVLDVIVPLERNEERVGYDSGLGVIVTTRIQGVTEGPGGSAV